MALTMLYFAWVREAVGTGEEQVSPPAGVDTVDALIDWLAARGDGHRQAFADRTRLRAAVDGRFAPLSITIDGAREVAIFPPVTGG